MYIKKIIFTLPKYSDTIFNRILQNGGSARFVGGYVRDYLVNQLSTDFDIVTNLKPQEIINIFRDTEFKVITTGIQYGTITLIIKETVFEITTLREDIKCFGRHAEIRFTNSWLLDSRRRDFTINALYLDHQGYLSDYHTSLNDLEECKVKFIGDPHARITEDALRILRYFRFISYLGWKNIDVASMNVCIDEFKKLKIISSERIKYEFFKLLIQPYALKTIILMIKRGLMIHIGINSSFYDLNSLQYVKFFLNDPIANLASILLHSSYNQQTIINLKANLKLSRKEYCDLNKLLSFTEEIFSSYHHCKYSHEFSDVEYTRFLSVIKNKPGINNLDKYLDKNVNCKSFPINGYDILNLGIDKRLVSNVLAFAQNIWYNNPLLEKKMLLGLIKDKFC